MRVIVTVVIFVCLVYADVENHQAFAMEHQDHEAFAKQYDVSNVVDEGLLDESFTPGWPGDTSKSAKTTKNKSTMNKGGSASKSSNKATSTKEQPKPMHVKTAPSVNVATSTKTGGYALQCRTTVVTSNNAGVIRVGPHGGYTMTGGGMVENRRQWNKLSAFEEMMPE